MYGVDGNTFGACHTDTRKNWDCNYDDDKLKLHGKRNFRCLTSITANEINDAKRKEGKKDMEMLSHNGAAVTPNTTAVAWTG